MNWLYRHFKMIQLFLDILWRLPEKKSGIPKQYQMTRISWSTAWDVASSVWGDK